ncbi:MAG: putative oxidoreductase [Acidimicrobiales bacterium]|nr:MAG: SDR family oxidoreductase [Actinomycetota bacterium]MBV6507807.1 putative oxidoreductase [Acidimicrobiales bacterium]RIK05964.1 MAG: short chain dehydrogenase [Acidobacteriota bacterium]
MGLLAGETAIITGGGSGIGRAAAHRFVEEGAAVAVFDVDGDSARAVADELDGVASEVDVTDADGLADAVADAARHMGGLSIMVNNAGIGGLSPLASYPLDEWDRIVRVNLHGVFNGIRASAPLMREAGGVIVNTASISGVRPAAGEGPYAAAKAGVSALTASAALEYGPRIRVNSVAPGSVRTALTEPLLESLPAQIERQIAGTPLGRMGEPEDVADVMVFLCSGLARYVTGQTIVVDGGMILHGSGVDGLLDAVSAEFPGVFDQS